MPTAGRPDRRVFLEDEIVAVGDREPLPDLTGVDQAGDDGETGDFGNSGATRTRPWGSGARRTLAARGRSRRWTSRATMTPASGARRTLAARGRSAEADAHAAGLALLAGRDLSGAQVGERLRRRGFSPAAADAAVARLRADGALDDRRAAEAYARRAVELRRQGPARIARELAARGVDAAVARAAIDEACAGRDEHELLDRALARRLDGRITTPAEFRRLQRYLLRQGFDGALAQAALRRRAAPDAAPDD